MSNLVWQKRVSRSFGLVIFGSGLLLIVFLLATFSNPQVGAQSPGNQLMGYAWSSNIGWVSFNCLNNDSCSDSSYRVVVEEDGDDLNLVGYAWSSNIGWIKFGELSEFPDGEGTEPVNARFNSEGDGLEGWARACVGTDGEDCRTMDDSDEGWNGWISLSGDGSGDGYGVDYEDGRFSGYAFSSQVIGWLSFAGDDGENGDIYQVFLEGFDYRIDHDHGESSDNALVINLGSDRDADIDLNLVFGDEQAQEVELSTRGSLPAGVVVSFSEDTCSPTCVSTMTVEVGEGAEEGDHTILITGEDESGYQKTSEFYINITDSDASVELSAAPTIVEAGGDPTTIEWFISGAKSCETSGDWGPWVNHDTGTTDGFADFGFDEEGSYQFILECVDDDDNVAQDSVRVIVLDETEFHIVSCYAGDAPGEQRTSVGQTVTWEAEAEQRADGAFPEGGYTYEWEGDLGSNRNPGDNEEFDTTYSTIGLKEVSVTVTNNENGVAVIEDCDPLRVGVDPGFEIF